MNTEQKGRVEQLVLTHARALPEIVRAALSAALCQLVESELRVARERTVALCLRRGDLWQKTSDQGGRLAEEARARANEALYLADMIETGQDLPETGSSGSGAASGGIQARGLKE